MKNGSNTRKQSSSIDSILQWCSMFFFCVKHITFQYLIFRCLDLSLLQARSGWTDANPHSAGKQLATELRKHLPQGPDLIPH